jgi:GT2 family glycosyltransferase
MGTEFSVLICSKNGGRKLERMLESLFMQSIEIPETILIDDGSIPATQVDTDRIKLIRNERSAGLIACRNKLAGLASGEFMYFLDDDVILDDRELIHKTLKILRADPRIGALGINQKSIDGVWLDLQPARKIPGVAQVYFGWAHVIKRSVWDVVGPFREAFGYGWEESDFSLRLWNKGYKVVSSDSLSVIHDCGSSAKNLAHRHFLNTRNSILSILLNFPAVLLPSWLKGLVLNSSPIPNTRENKFFFRLKIFLSVLLFLPYVIKHRDPVSMEAMGLYFNKINSK